MGTDPVGEKSRLEEERYRLSMDVPCVNGFARVAASFRLRDVVRFVVSRRTLRSKEPIREAYGFFFRE